MDANILFTDLDGTLLNDQSRITPGNQRAIDEALSDGHRIVIATGRPLASAIIQARRLGLVREGCFAITYNGGLIYDLFHGKTLYGKTVPRELALTLFQAANDRGLHIQTYSDTHVLACQKTRELVMYTKSTLLPYQIIGCPPEELPGDPYKLLAIDLSHPEKLHAFQKEVLSRYQEELHSFFSNDHYLEIVPRGIDKGFAVRWLCDFLGIPLERSVAAGDAQNDIAMLEAAHIGAVMCNAFPGIAEHGNYVTTADNNHDGVAEIIRRFILS